MPIAMAQTAIGICEPHAARVASRHTDKMRRQRCTDGSSTLRLAFGAGLGLATMPAFGAGNARIKGVPYASLLVGRVVSLGSLIYAPLAVVHPSHLGYAMAIAIPMFYLPGLLAGYLFGRFVELYGWSVAATLTVCLPACICFVLMLFYRPSEARGG